MENNLENKARFFAQYWGQKVLWSFLYSGMKKCESFFLHKENISINDYLLLTPLSAITYEDAIEVAVIMSFCDGEGFIVEKDTQKAYVYDAYNDNPYSENVLIICLESLDLFSLDDEGEVFQYDWRRFIEATDYLRSKSYYIGDGTEIEYGWVKLKEA